MYKVIKISLAIASVICLFEMPYGYFELYRYFALGVFIFLAVKSQNDLGWLLTWVMSAILIQPFIKIPLGKEIWEVVDVSWASLLVISALYRVDHLFKIKLSFRRFFAQPAVMIILGIIWIFGTHLITEKYDELIDHAYDQDHFHIRSSQKGDVIFSCDCDSEIEIDFDSFEEAEEFRGTVQEASLRILENVPLLNKCDLENYGSVLSFFFMLIAIGGNILCIWLFLTHNSFK